MKLPSTSALEEKLSWLEASRVFAIGALAAAMLAAAALYLYVARRSSFYFDEWNFILNRRGMSGQSLLGAHNGHLSLIPVLAYKVLLQIFGMHHYLPYRLMPLGLHLVSVGLLFVFVRRRLPQLVALAAAVALLFLGSAWQDIIWPFQVGYMGSIASGLAMFVAFDRQSRAGDLAASVLLAVSLASSGVGIAFAAAAIVQVLWSADRVSRLWVFGTPLLLYALWYGGYGDSQATSDSVLAAPRFAADMVAGALGGLSGLGIDWGRPLAVLAAVVLARALVGIRPGPITVAAIALPLVFWAGTSLSRAGVSSPDASRYIYPGVVGILLIAAEVARRGRVATSVTLAVWVLVAGVAVANLSELRSGARGLRSTAELTRGELTAVELARASVKPEFQPDPERMPQVRAGRYLEAARDFGSPAFTPSRLEKRPEGTRAAADRALVGALEVTFEFGPAPLAANAPRLLSDTVVRRAGPCLRWRPGGTAALELELVSPGAAVTARRPGPVEIRLRRFADAFPDTASVTATGPVRGFLRLPADRSPKPWVGRLTAQQPLVVCSVRRDRLSPGNLRR